MRMQNVPVGTNNTTNAENYDGTSSIRLSRGRRETLGALVDTFNFKSIDALLAEMVTVYLALKDKELNGDKSTT